MIRRIYHRLRIARAKAALVRAERAIDTTKAQQKADLKHYRTVALKARAHLVECEADAAIAGALHLDASR